MSKNFKSPMTNATVSYPEAIHAKAANRKALEAHVASQPEYNRVKRGERALKHDIKEEVYEDGGAKTVTTKITTKRTNR